MKTLVLFRHAKSSWKYAELKDFDRPLKKRGKKDAERMSAVLESHVHPDLFITSPAERAFSTAAIVAGEMGLDEDRIVKVPGLYLETASRMLEQVHAINDTYDTVCLFGHNPGLTDLANALTGESLDSIPTSGIYGIRLDVESWKEVAFGQGKTLFFEKPSDHRKKGRKKKKEEPVEAEREKHQPKHQELLEAEREKQLR